MADSSSTTISSELARVGLGSVSDHWERVLEEEFGVSSVQALQYLGGESYPTLERYAESIWEKKALRQLLNIDEKAFIKQREEQKEKQKARYKHAHELLQKLIVLESERKDRNHPGVKEVENEVRERLQIPPREWVPVDIPLVELISHLQGHIRGVLQLTQKDDVNSSTLLKRASGGLALQGIFLSKTLDDQLSNRSSLLKTLKEIELKSPAHPQNEMITCFTNKDQDHSFKNAVNKLGYSATVSTDSPGFWAEKNIWYSVGHNDHEQTKDQCYSTEDMYLSTVRYSSLPLASFAFNNSQLLLTGEALSDLTSIETEIKTQQNGPEEISLKCKHFFLKFGSHVCRGPIHFGGVYWRSCSSNCTECLKDSQCVKQLQADCIGMPNCVLTSNEVAAEQIKRSYSGKYSESILSETHLELSMTGSSVQANTSSLLEWKNGLIASNSMWSVIDRGTTLVPIWEIVEMNYSRKFKGELVQVLKKEWEAVSGFDTKPEIDVCLTSVSYSQTDVLSEIDNWIDIQGKLKRLLEVKNDLLDKQTNPNAWSSLYLKQPQVQQFLKLVVDQQSGMPAPSEPVKELMAQIAGRAELNELDFPDKGYISHWLYGVQLQHPHSPIPLDIDDFLVFGKYLENVGKHLTAGANYNGRGASIKNSDCRRPMETKEHKNIVNLLAEVASNILAFRHCIGTSDQKYQNLFISTVIYPLIYGISYEPVILKHLSVTDVKYLCDMLTSASEEFFDLMKGGNLSRAQAYLFLLTIDSYLKSQHVSSAQQTSQVDISAEQAHEHLQYLKKEIGEELYPKLRDVLPKHKTIDIKQWKRLKLKILPMVTLCLPMTRDTGHSLDIVLDTVKEIPVSHPTSTSKNGLLTLPGKRVVEKLFIQLDLRKHYPQQLTLQDALCIRQNFGRTRCTHPGKLYLVALQKLMACDYRCRVNLLHTRDTSEEFSDGSDDEFSCEDVENGDDINSSEFHQEKESLDESVGSTNAKAILTGSFSESESDEYWSCDDDNESREEAQPRIDKIHPMDVMLALVHCADDFLRQDLFTRLAKCQLSIPFILPDPFTGQLTFPLWGMRSIVKEWKSTLTGIEGTEHEGPLVSFRIPIISFVRFSKQEKSKSKIMNDIISNSHHDHFFHRDCAGGNFQGYLGDGLIDLCWYLPAGKVDDIFLDAIAFVNLHGDARDHPHQCALLSEISFMTFALFNTDDLDENAEKIVTQFSRTSGGVVLLQCDKKKLPTHLPYHKRSVPEAKVKVFKLLTKNLDEIKEGIRKQINQKLHKRWADAAERMKKLEELTEVMDKYCIEVDECKKEFIKGQEMALAIQSMLDDFTGDDCRAKTVMLPLQGKSLWQKWAMLEKEEHRQLNRGLKTIEEYSAEKQQEKDSVRLEQREQVQNLSTAMVSFIVSLLSHTGCTRNYFLQCLKLSLNNSSRHIIALLQHEYKEKRKELQDHQRKKNSEAIDSIKKEIEGLHNKIIDASLGLEHFLRELGQVYEALPADDESELTQQYSRLPRAAAELLIEGYALELMDGDAAHVPKKWVVAVLREVAILLNDPKIFVMSVLGLQSTGKSTLMNTAFGLQFSVSAGRCTRGAFMQLLPISDSLKEEAKCDYVLVVDTEGLRAPELDPQQTQKHDNQLATFVIGLANLTLINIYGETPGDLDDILQTAIHAFLRMRSVKLTPSCQFVHQNVGSVSARGKGEIGRARFKDKLDNMTRLAAKEEKCAEEYEFFSDVIQFNPEKNVHHFPGLWQGDPPMAPVNNGYSEKAITLKSHLVDVTKNLASAKLSVFQTRLGDLWKALLHEKFVFSFRNSMEIAAYYSMEAKYTQWAWSFKTKMLEWEQKAGNEMKNTKGDSELKKLQNILLVTKLPGHVTTIREELEKEMKLFFEQDDQCDILVQWQKETELRLIRLSRELEEHAKSYCKELTSAILAQDTVKNMKEKYQAQIIKKVKDHVASLDGKELKQDEQTDDDIRKMFDEQWEIWIEDVKTTAPVHWEEIDVEERVQTSLTEFFRTEEQSVIMKLRQRSLRSWGRDLALEMQNGYVTYKKGLLQKAIDFFKGESTKLLSNPLLKQKVEDATSFVFKRVSMYLEDLSKQSEKFNPLFTSQLLQKLVSAIGEVTFDVPGLTVTREYTIDMSLTACGYAVKIFEGMVDDFRAKNDPEVYLKTEMKAPLYTLFKNKYLQTANEKAAACIFCDLLRSPVDQQVKNSLGNEVFKDMKELRHFENKSALKYSIMTDLAEDQMGQGSTDLDDYFLYLEHSQTSLQRWCERYTREHCQKKVNGRSKLMLLASKTLKQLVQEVRVSVEEVTNEWKEKEDKEEELDTEQWLNSFCIKVRSILEVKIFDDFQDLGDVKTIKDVENFTHELTCGLQTLEASILASYNQTMTVHELDSLSLNKPYDLLYNHLCGCPEQCPFCKEQCDCTNVGHQVPHSCQQHRPQCLGGMRWSATQQIATEVCNADVGSDGYFLTNDTAESHPYKDYQKVYPKWSIPVDCSAEGSSYWKWFVGHYAQEIATHFNARAKKTDTIDAWSKLEWKKVAVELKDSFKM